MTDDGPTRPRWVPSPLWTLAEKTTLRADEVAADDAVRGAHIGEAFSNLGLFGGILAIGVWAKQKLRSE